MTERHDGPTDITEWNRAWIDDSKLRLTASGTYFDGEVWHDYDETIDKIVVSISWLERCCQSAGLAIPEWLSDDLETKLADPEAHGVAFAVTRRCR